VPKKAIAIAMAGKVNGAEFPLMEFDHVPLWFVVDKGFELKEKFNLNRFVIFKTRNGFHLRFYFDNTLTHDQIIEIINASGTTKEYARIARRFYCNGRVTGKYKKPDLIFMGFYGALKNKGSREVEIGLSLLKLHCLFSKVKLKRSVLL